MLTRNPNKPYKGLKGCAMLHETTETFVELFYPGSFFPETDVVRVARRAPKRIAKTYPHTYAFQFFDQTSAGVEVDGVKRRVCGNRKNLSPTYFPAGTVMDVAAIKKLKGDYRILISNMECNKWPQVVQTRCGNFQPFDEKKCQVL